VKYRVLPDAQRDIHDIDDWVVEHFGAEFADRTQAKLYDTFDLLTDFPQMGSLRPDIESRPVASSCSSPTGSSTSPAHRCSSIASTTPPATSTGSAFRDRPKS